jgi:hypothetical protein
MKLLNRSGISIRPKQPFYDWLQANFAEELPTFEELCLEGNLYLFDEVESEEDFDSALDQHWAAIFENELGAWDEFGDYWPELTRTTFDDWLAVDLQLICFDVSKQPLMRADLDIG